MLTLAILAMLMWLGLLLAPWRPWSTRERLTADAAPATDFSDVTALLPARDEALSIARTLTALDGQGRLGGIVLVDDESSDGTAAIAAGLGIERLEIVAGTAPPPGWSGKLWALNQGLEHVDTPLVLLLDADIELAPGTLSALVRRLREDNRQFVSVMATLHMESAWEKLLLPPFIYFFKLIYPFSLANDRRSRVAAAAGGCILLEKSRLDAIGGFAAVHDAIIDDCTLAARIKRTGASTWLGLSEAVRAVRPYEDLGTIWNMVARSAFTQLRYSTPLLLLATVLLLVSFAVPPAALLAGGEAARLAGAAALAAMLASYFPTVRYYALHPGWVLTLPLAAALFLAMTWTSAMRYWRGERSRWKARSYDRATT
ncbi:MAG: glycosyltransferase [Gammaproteobacteria bacterium]